jgi:universal stress protein E
VLRHVRIDPPAVDRQGDDKDLAEQRGVMDPIRSILVAVKDPRAPSHPGVAKAAQLAEALGAELTLFQAVPTPLSAAVEASEGTTRPHHGTLEYQDDLLELIAQRLRRRGLRVSVSVRWDHPVHAAILQAAAEARADLIVAEAHSRSHHGAALLQLTDWALVRHSPVAVLLVKRPQLYRRPNVLVALDPDHTFGKPPRLDTEILALGSALTQALHGALHAVHAFAPVEPGAVPHQSTSALDISRVQHDNEAIAARKLAAAVSPAGVSRANQHVVGRHVPDAIEQVAAHCRSAIVVMGAVARSGLTHVLIGNTAERLLDLLTCDMLVVKPPRLATRTARNAELAQSAALPVIPGA